MAHQAADTGSKRDWNLSQRHPSRDAKDEGRDGKRKGRVQANPRDQDQQE
jgi:hypothetical protein